MVNMHDNTQAREWGRQRDFSERRLKAWKHKSKLVDDKSKYLNNKRVAENSALIVECNDLRMANRELRCARPMVEVCM